jgi:hypothetical protein
LSDTPPEAVAPLDAYVTAKPDEPTWTAQGGDPLAAPLLRVWAHFARIMAGCIPPRGLENIFEQLVKAAQHNLPDTEREREALQLRATQTEFISFDMDSYRAGRTAAEDPNTPAENTLDDKARLDLHDLRVRYSQKISGMVADLAEIENELLKHEFKEAASIHFTHLMKDLEWIKNVIEPRRLFKR